MNYKDDRNLNILALWLYWIIVGEPEKRDSLNRKVDNLQFLTWFENRAKNNLSQEEWNKIKDNIGDYLV